MKRIILISMFIFVITALCGQTPNTTSTTDWNQVWQSGFYQSEVSKSSNNPPITAYRNWWWGINVAHSLNNANYRYNGQILFEVNPTSAQAPTVYIRSTNESGIGLWAKVIHSKGNHAIDGKLTVKEVEVKVNTGADHVFYPDYALMPLSEVESFVKENKHLPEIPSEKQMVEEGLNVNEMQIKLLQKIEELTLYMIEQDKKIEKQDKRIRTLEEENKKLKED